MCNGLKDIESFIDASMALVIKVLRVNMLLRIVVSFGVFISFVSPASAEKIFELGVGAAAVSLPTYPGSDDQSFYALPLPYLYYKDDYITLDREGLVGNLFESQRWELDASFSGGIPVNSEKSSAREGMSDLDWTLEAGPRLLYYFSDKKQQNGYLRAQLFLRKVLATDLTYVDSIGYRAGLGLESEQQLTVWSKTLIWTNRLTINWANHDFLDYFYAVADSEANENRAPYSSHSGYASTELSTGLALQFEQLRIGAFARYQNFSAADTRNSPLLQSNANLTVGIGFVWILRSSK